MDVGAQIPVPVAEVSRGLSERKTLLRLSFASDVANRGRRAKRAALVSQHRSGNAHPDHQVVFAKVPLLNLPLISASVQHGLKIKPIPFTILRVCDIREGHLEQFLGRVTSDFTEFP